MYIQNKCTFKTNVHSKRMYIQNKCTFGTSLIIESCALGRIYLQNECTFKTNVHSKRMYIQNECTFKMNVHSKRMYIWHIIDHVCHILCIIATLWPCLPHFDYNCHSVGMYICAKCTSGPNVNSQRMYICVECTLNVHLR